MSATLVEHYAHTGLTSSSPVLLELLVARDITPLLDTRVSMDRSRRPTCMYDEVADILASQPQTPAILMDESSLVQQDTVLAKPQSFPLLPAHLLPRDLQFIGLYGMNVDPRTGHIWFSSNWLPYIHELDSTFGLVTSYLPEEDPTKLIARRKVANYRRIWFPGEGLDHRAYVTDAGSPSYGSKATPALHVFGRPGFSHHRQIDLDSFGRGFSPTHITFHNDRLIVGCTPCGRNVQDLTRYRVISLDPSTYQTEHVDLEGIVHLFSYNGTLYGLSDHRADDGSRKGILIKYFLFRFQGGFSPAETVELDLPRLTIHNEELHVDPRGYLFRYGHTIDKTEDTFYPTLTVVDMNGDRLASTRLPFSIPHMCFDQNNNLLALVHHTTEDGSRRLIGLKYAVHYNF
jgi:hypothetical protein